jgi:hypothetical protein
MGRVGVAIEAADNRVFATAVDWPGWSRSGKTEEAAIAALLAYAARYDAVAARARESLDPAAVEARVVERVTGGGGTAFGVPSLVTDHDRRPTSAREAGRLAGLVRAAWETFDAIAASAPAELRKGPRGGGRDTAKIVEHVLGAEHAYAREMGLRLPAPDPDEPATIERLRAAMLETLAAPSDGSPLADRRWTVRYAAHRIAWHALDHAWEIEDRSEPAG